MGQGVGRVWRPPAPRVERARPFSDEFWRFGPDKGPSTVQKRFSMMARAVEGAPDCAPHPATRHISRMRVRRALHRCLQHFVPWMQQRRCLCRTLRESSRERRVGDGAGNSSSEAGRAHEGDGGDMGCEGKYISKMQHDRAGHARHEGPVLPSRDVNRTQLRAGL